MNPGQSKFSWLPDLVFVLMLALLPAHHFFAFFGHAGYDDMEYARLAAGIASGNWTFGENHYAYRIGLTAPTALFYKLFGIHDWTTGLWSMLCSGAILWGIRLESRRWSIVSKSLALIFAGATFWLLYYADKLLPDMPLACWIFFSLILIRRRHVLRWAGAAFAFCVLAGMLTKGMILFLIPVWMWFLLTDMRRGESLRFWMIAGVCLIIPVLLSWGWWMDRAAAIELARYPGSCSYELLPAAATWRRIGYEFWMMLLKSGAGLLLLIVLIGWKKRLAFWAGVAAITVLVANFGSWRLDHYVPMCPDIRHYLWLIPPLSLSAAAVLPAILQSGFRKRGWMLAAAIVLVLASGSIWTDYLVLIGAATVLLISPWLPAFNRKVLVLAALVAGVWLVRPIYSFGPGTSRPYRQSQFLVQRFAASEQEGLVVLHTDPVTANVGPYWLDFDSSKVRFQAIPSEPVPEASNYLFRSSRGEELAKVNYEADWLSEQYSGTHASFKLKGSAKLWRLEDDQATASPIISVDSTELE